VTARLLAGDVSSAAEFLSAEAARLAAAICAGASVTNDDEIGGPRSSSDGRGPARRVVSKAGPSSA
jgi:hypothetical protein